jgi:hypothetical protein
MGQIRLDTIERRNWNFQITGQLRMGREMYVFPPVQPRLDIIEAAGQQIPLGIAGPVQVTLSPNSSTDQIVRLRAQDFTGPLRVEVVVVPESGPKRVYPIDIDTTVGNPQTVPVTVGITPDMVNRIYAWTR